MSLLPIMIQHRTSCPAPTNAVMGEEEETRVPNLSSYRSTLSLGQNCQWLNAN